MMRKALVGATLIAALALTGLLASASLGQTANNGCRDGRFVWQSEFSDSAEGTATKFEAVDQGMENYYPSHPSVAKEAVSASNSVTYRFDASGKSVEVDDAEAGIVMVEGLPDSPQVTVDQLENGTWIARAGSFCTITVSEAGSK